MQAYIENYQKNTTQVKQEMEKLSRVIAAMEKFQTDTLAKISYNGTFGEEGSNYVAVAQHLELLRIMLRALEILNSNPFYSIENMLNLLAPKKDDSGERLTLTDDYLELYIDTLAENIIAMTDDKRKELYTMFAIILAISIISGIGMGIVCSVGGPMALGVVLAVLFAGTFCTSVIGGGVSIQENQQFDLTQKYLKASQTNTTLQLKSEDYVFAHQPRYQNSDAVHIEAINNRVYCRLRSGLVTAFFSTVELSEALSAEIKPLIEHNQSHNLDTQLSDFKERIFAELNQRPFTTTVFCASSTWKQHLNQLENSFRTGIKVLSGTRPELRERFFRHADTPLAKQIVTNEVLMQS